jgi:archaellum component FlaF (FlaF/FlaG flagellin family)
MRCHKRTKRGLSTIVTGAILLTAVAMMGIMVVAWANSNLTKHQIELETTLTDTYNKLNEKILIEHVWFGNVGPSINITMNNIGTVGLNVTEIKITNITSSQMYSFPYTDAGIVSGGTLSLNDTFGWITDTPYEVLITTNRDSQFRTEVLSP